MNPSVFRTPQAAEYLSLSPSTLEKLRISGQGPPFIRLGLRAIGYLKTDLDDWLESRRNRSTAEYGLEDR